MPSLDQTARRPGSRISFVIEEAELRAEVERLRNIEALRDILQGDYDRVKQRLNAALEKIADLKDSLDGMTTDMSLMEETIRYLSGNDPEASDFGP